VLCPQGGRGAHRDGWLWSLQAPAPAAADTATRAAPATLAVAPITIAPLGAAPAPTLPTPTPVAASVPVVDPVPAPVEEPAPPVVAVEEVTAASALLTSSLRADGFVEVLGGDGSGLVRAHCAGSLVCMPSGWGSLTAAVQRQRAGAAAGRVHDANIAETMVVGNDRPTAAPPSGTSAPAAPAGSALGSLSPWAAWTWLTTPTVAPPAAAPAAAAPRP
jgi:hypothetical protein